jgi:hypothetical protein
VKRGRKFLKIETEWLRAYARTYLPCEDALVYPPEVFRREHVDLLHFACLLRRGRVVSAEKLDEPGAVWIVEGQDCDDNDLRATLVVQTQEMSLRILDVERLHREQEAKTTAA